MWQTDVSDASQLTDLIPRISVQLGPIEVLIFNVYILRPGKPDASSLATLMGGIASSSVFYVTAKQTPRTYNVRLNSGATETVDAGPTIGSTRSLVNNVNELLGQEKGGTVKVQGLLSKPKNSITIGSNVILLSCGSPNSTSYNVSAGTGGGTITIGTTYSGNAVVTIGGVATASQPQALSLTVNDSRLPSGQKSYTVQYNNSLSAVAAASLAQQMNSDSDLKSIGIIAQTRLTADMETAQKLSGDPQTSGGQNQIFLSNNTDLKQFYLPVSGKSLEQGFSYDANGNITNDGSNTYSWDAENRLTRMSSGTGKVINFEFAGNGLNVKTQEEIGSVTTTKQFVWSGTIRCEERDGDGVLTKKLFEKGQQVGNTNYTYLTDHLGSVREVCDINGGVVAQYSYDPAGMETKLQEIEPSDVRFGGYYKNSTFDLLMPVHRVYSPTLGRFLNRDPKQEGGGINLFAYLDNNPVSGTDPLGLQGKTKCCAQLPRQTIQDMNYLLNKASEDQADDPKGRERGGTVTINPMGRISQIEHGTPQTPNSFGAPPGGTDVFESHHHLKPAGTQPTDMTPSNDISKACSSRRRLWVLASNGDTYMYDGNTCKGCSIHMYIYSKKGALKQPCQVINWCQRPIF